MSERDDSRAGGAGRRHRRDTTSKLAVVAGDAITPTPLKPGVAPWDQQEESLSLIHI